jgi:nitrogen fixation protein FixH
MTTKRNLWPYGIVASFVAFIGGTVCLIVMACSSPSDLVAKDYYEQEIRFQKQMERSARAALLEQRTSLSYDAAAQQIRLVLPAEHAADQATGTVELYRPSESALDKRLALGTDSTGVQTIDAKQLKPGSWKVRVSWAVGAEEFYLERAIVVADSQTPVLR